MKIVITKKRLKKVPDCNLGNCLMKKSCLRTRMSDQFLFRLEFQLKKIDRIFNLNINLIERFELLLIIVG
jgi:hypothetical protein